MKIVIITFILVFSQQLVAQDFDSDWLYIIRNAQNVWDENDLQRAENDASSLADEIDDYIDDNEDELGRGKLAELKSLMKRAEAMEDFVGSVLRGRSYPFSIKAFKSSVAELGARYSLVSSSYCLAVYKLELNGYAILIAWNSDSSLGYKMVCSYAQIGGNSSGKYTGLVTKNSVRPMGDNRDNKQVDSWKITGMTCETYISPY